METQLYLPLSGYGEGNTEYNNSYTQNGYKQRQFGGWDRSYHPGGDSGCDGSYLPGGDSGCDGSYLPGGDGSYHPGVDSGCDGPPQYPVHSYTMEQGLGVGNRLLQVTNVPRETHSAPPPGDRPDSHSAPPPGDRPEGGRDIGDQVPESRHRRRRQHRGRHHHRMRLHDSNVRRLLDVGGAEEVEVPCTCEGTETTERLGHWGSTASRTVPNPARPQPKPKKPPQHRRSTRHSQRAGSAGMYHLPPEEDHFRFRHYEDTGLYMKQYRQEHTICIQGADPTQPPVLGRDTPDPYLAKLQQCGDLLERLMALTAIARQHAELEENRCERKVAWVDVAHKVPRLPVINQKHKTLRAIQQYRLNIRCRLQDRPLTKAVQSERASRDFSSPDLNSWNQTKHQVPRKAVNLAPIRDCRLSVKNIQFPQKQPPRRQAAHIQHQLHTQQQQQQTAAYHHPLPTELQTPRVAFPLPVRIVVNSESLKGNKLTTLSPPHTPTTRRRRLSRSESTEHQNSRPSNPTNNNQDARYTKKRSEGDIRCPQLSTTSGSDLSIYDQYLAQRNKGGVKEDTTGHFLFAPVTKATSSGGSSRKRESSKKPSIGLCELYSSTSGTLITAVNNR